MYNSNKLGQVGPSGDRHRRLLVYSDGCHWWGNIQPPLLSHHLLQRPVVLLVLKIYLKENHLSVRNTLLPNVGFPSHSAILTLATQNRGRPNGLRAESHKTIPHLQTSIPSSKAPGLPSLLFHLVTNQRFLDCLLGFSDEYWLKNAGKNFMSCYWFMMG